MDGTLPMELSPPYFAGCNSPWRELKIHLAQLVYWYCPWRNEKLSFPDTRVAWHWYTQTPDSPRMGSSPASHNPQHTKSHHQANKRHQKRTPASETNPKQCHESTQRFTIVPSQPISGQPWDPPHQRQIKESRDRVRRETSNHATENHHVSQLVAKHYHHKAHHQERQITQSAIRQVGFWLIEGHDTVTKVIGACILCKKLRGPKSVPP